ncbi:MAG: response regulator [Butyrivibrio sp.]|nr:response regulator [Butyrivibrio sp.]
MKKYYFAINKRSLALICVGVVFNIMGRSISYSYSIPFFLDTIGTVLVSVILGPIAGAITGVIYNFIGLFMFSMNLLYALVSISGAFVVGFFLYKRERVDSFKIVGTSVLAGVVTTIVSTPINLMIQSGMTGNLWGDALVQLLSQYISVKLVCCLAGELLVNIPDKILTVIVIMESILFLRKAGFNIITEEDAEVIEGSAKRNVNKNISLLIMLPVIIACSVYILPVKAEDSIDFSADYAYTVFDMDDGLSSAEINSIVQTNDGYIWAGSYSGLYRYDGVNFENVNVDNRICSVTKLFSDSKGRLWIGTNDSGVACYNLETEDIQFFSTKDGLASNSIRDICEGNDGDIYVSTSVYMYKISLSGNSSNDKEKEDVLITSFEDTDIKYAHSLVPVDGYICGVTDDGVIFVVNNGKVAYSLECDFAGEEYSSIGYSQNGSLIAGTTGVHLDYIKLSEDGLKKESRIIMTDLSSVNNLHYKESFKGYFVACDDGFGFVDTSHKMQNLTVDYFNTGISNIVFDQQSNIWLSSNKQGIMKLSANPFADLFKKIDHKTSAVNAVMIDDGHALIGTDSGLLEIDLSANNTVTDEEQTIVSGDRVRHIMKDSKGNVWISTYGAKGLIKVNTDREITSISDENSELGTRIRFALELQDGRILAASSDGLCFIKGEDVVKKIGSEDGLEVEKVLSAIEDNDGALWVGTDGGGVYKIVNDKITEHWGYDKGLFSEVIMKIVACEGGRIYVASNGLYFHEKDGDIRKLENFPYSNNYDVYISENNQAFISSSAGLFVVGEKELIADEEGYAYTLLNNKRGLNTTLTSNAWNAIDGDVIYLCCTDGVQVMNVKDYADFDQNYQITLRNFLKDGEEIKLQDGLYDVPSGNGQIEITPAILNYTVSDPLIRIELEGIDKEPRLMHQSSIETLYYSNIPYGDYRLKIQVMDETGNKAVKEKIFLINKEAELYEYTYYKIYVFGVIAVILLFIAWLVAKMGNMAVINNQYDQIKEAKDAAELANQTKSRFLAQMSHEIRTPINAVLGMDEMILRESREPDIRGYAFDIYNAGKTLLSLINDILDSSKLESGKMEIVPVEYELTNLIRDIVNMSTQRAQKKDLILDTYVDPDLPKVLYGDDVRLRQIVINLMTNAIKYTMAGNVWLRVTGTRKGGSVNLHVEVEDTGIGIKEEDLPKLFEQFKRIDEGRNKNIEGTGLGMNITIQLLELMGSHLEVNSIYGKGSKFFFDIEQKIVDNAAIGDFDKTAKIRYEFEISDNAFTAEDARVLVVDDNSMNRKVLRSLLKPVKIQVSEAASGAEAIAMVEWEHYDVIFMDHMMPEMDGVQTMKKMREMDCCKGIPIYALTANALSGAKEEYISMGFDGFLAKPVESDKLEEVLRISLSEEKIKPLTEDERKEFSIKNNKSDSNVPDNLPDVEGLDWNYAWIHLPDTDMLREGVTSFYEILNPQADRLQELYNQLLPKVGNKSSLDNKGDLEESNDSEDPLNLYKIQVHGMKSGAATIGIVPLAGMAKVLEFAAKNADMKTIHALHETFINEWRSYEEKLKGAFGVGFEVEDQTDIEGSRQAGDKVLFETMLELLIQAMDNMDIDTADEVMNKMRNYTFGDEIDSKVPKLYSAVKNLDDNLFEKMIKEMKELI